MSTETPSTSTVSAHQQRTSRYLIGAGILVVLLGVAAILSPFVAGVGLSITLGALLVVGGLTHTAHAFSARGWAGSLWQIALAVIYAVAGISLLANPVLGLTTLTLLLIAYLAISGLLEVILGVQIRPEPQWGWFIASGSVSLLLSGLLWAGFPSNAEWAVGLLVGFHFLTTGFTLIVVGYLGQESSARGKEFPERSSQGG